MGNKKVNYSKLLKTPDRILPPISKFLGNPLPFIEDQDFIFTNNNRVFCFLSTNSNSSSNPSLSTNLQISLYNFIISSYINELQKNSTLYDPNFVIHKNDNLNSFIHTMINSNDNILLSYQTSLTLTVANNNAIQPLINYNVSISAFNYILTLVLHSLENNPGLFFGNNSYATCDPINLNLAREKISIPIDLFYEIYDCAKCVPPI